MKATGIVRRIDDLGRVVIPKEIRRTMRIREGDPLEIFTDREGGVIFKKYSPLNDLSAFAGDICASLYGVTGVACAVCDNDSVIAFAGSGKKDVLERPVSKGIEEIISSRKAYLSESSDLPLTSDSAQVVVAAYPIIAAGDALGAVAFIKTADKPITEADLKLVTASAVFIGKQMEN